MKRKSAQDSSMIRRLLSKPQRHHPMRPLSQLAQLEHDVFARLLGDVRGQRVLELGCGDGRGARLLIERGAHQVIALDHSPRALVSRDAFLHPAIVRLAGSAERLPLAAGTCQTIVARRSLSAVADLDAVLEEAAAVLRPAGQLVITDIHPYELLGHGASAEGSSPRAHLVADYFEIFSRWGFELEALEEPRWQDLPRVVALRARRRSELPREPRQTRPRPSSTFDGRRLVSRSRGATRGWARLREELTENAAHLVELGWHGIFRLARTRRADVERLAPSGGRRILVVAALPGDEMLGAAAALLAHCRGGDSLSIFHATDGGEGERILELRRSQLAALRRYEAQEAANLLGARWHGMDETIALEAEPEDSFDRLATRLAVLLEELQPEILYAPSRLTTQVAIESVSRALAAAIGEAPKSLREIRVYPLDVPLGPILWSAALPTRRADLAPLLANTYLSRQRADAAALRRRRYDAELLGLPGLLETFWQLAPAQYRQLHRASAASAGKFRRLRSGPWGDPFAYLRGSSERRRLQRMAMAAGTGVS